MQLLVVLCLTVLFLSVSSKFTTTTTIPYSIIYSPSNTIYWDGKMYATIDVLNSPQLATQAKLVRYDVNGKQEAEWLMPLNCEALYCNINTQSVYLQNAQSKNPILVLYVTVDGCCTSYRWAMYGFDLAAWKLKYTLGGDKNYYSFVPFTDSTLYLKGSRPYFGAHEITLGAFDLDTFAPKGENNPVLLREGYGFLGYPGNNSVLGCVVLPDDSRTFASIDLATLKYKTYSLTGLSSCPVLGYYNGENPLPTPQPIYSTIDGNSHTYVSISTLDDPLKFLSTQTITGEYPTVSFADGENIFIFTRLWANQSKSRGYQFSYTSTGIELLDSIDVPQPWIVFPSAWPDVSYMASNILKQLAVPLLPPFSTQTQAMWVVNYDNTKNEKLGEK